MTFTEHLRELRNRLMVCAITITVIGIGMFYPSIYVINWMKREYYPNVTLHAFGPVDAVGTMFRFSLYSAIIIGLPVIMHQTLDVRRAGDSSEDARPGLQADRTRDRVWPIVGILFAHFVVIPVVIRGTTLLTSLIATETYGIGSTLNLVLLLFLAFALIFQLPMILIMLARIGLVSSKSLRTFRRYAIMGSLLAGGIAAPDGQPTTMMLMAAPLYILYEASIWIIIVLERSWKRENTALTACRAPAGRPAGHRRRLLTLVRQRLFRRVAVRRVGLSHADRRDRRTRQDARLLLGKLRAAAGPLDPAPRSRQHLSQPRIRRDHRADSHVARGLHVQTRDSGAASGAARGDDRSYPAPRYDRGRRRRARDSRSHRAVFPLNAAGSCANASWAARNGRSRIVTTGRGAAFSSRTSAS